MEDLRVDGRIVLKWALKRDAIELDSSDSECGPVAGSFDNDKELSGFIKGGEFPDHVRTF